MTIEVLPSLLQGRWQRGAGSGTAVADAVTGDTIVEVSSEGLDLAAAVSYARATGRSGLGELTFPQRAAALKAAVQALRERREELFELSSRAGATLADAAVDVDGGIGTALVYARLGAGLPDDTVLWEDDPIPLSRNGTFAGRHLLATPNGIAVQINAFNFPVWGMLEKLAPALLAGLPTLVKPATPTAYIAAHAVRIIDQSGALPPGAVQLVAGPVPGLLDLLGGQDHVGFTGSADTAARLRAHPAVTRRSLRFNAEADSLNCCVLGPDVVPGHPEFDLFVDAVVTEMTVKAGQKCTAIRRVFVPDHLVDAACEALTTRLERVVVGAPGAEGVTMGALVGLAQRDDVRAAADRIAAAGRIVHGDPHKADPVGADARRGAFMAPVLIRVDDAGRAEPHEVEAFGPVATVLPYRGQGDLLAQVARGEGSLAGSVVSGEPAFVRETVRGFAAHHGRLLVLDGNSAAESTGHGTPLPQLVHGGPGRAGGGQEEGGLRAVHAHLQRTAVQGDPAVLDTLARP